MSADTDNQNEKTVLEWQGTVGPRYWTVTSIILLLLVFANVVAIKRKDTEEARLKQMDIQIAQALRALPSAENTGVVLKKFGFSQTSQWADIGDGVLTSVWKGNSLDQLTSLLASRQPAIFSVAHVDVKLKDFEITAFAAGSAPTRNRGN